MTHNILVNAYCIAPDRIVAGTAGSYGLERMALTFSDEWKDVAKTVTFYPPKSRPVSVVLADGDEFDIPPEATAKSGEISFTVLGYRDGKRIFSVTGEMLVLATKNKEGVPSEEPTPSEKEQILAYVQDVKEMIDAGKIKGEDGYTPIKGVDYFDGKDGYTPIKGVDYFDGRDGYTPVKGVDYFDGEKGNDGYTPVKGIDYFDGKDGRDGQDGKDGADNLLVVTVNGNYKASHTASEINTFVQGGGSAVLVWFSNVFHAKIISASKCQFGTMFNAPTGATEWIMDVDANGTATFSDVVLDSLKNPNAITFTGAVEATYDGSKPVEVEIPEGGGGGNSVYFSEEEPTDAKTGDFWYDESEEEEVTQPLTFTGAVEATYDGSKPVGVNIPNKLSEYENDLYYSKELQFLTLHKEDFTLWENPDGDMLALYIVPEKWGWLESAESIKWNVSMSMQGQTIQASNEDTENGFYTDTTGDGGGTFDYYCDYFGISSGYDFKNTDEFISKEETVVYVFCGTSEYWDTISDITLELTKIETKRIESKYLPKPKTVEYVYIEVSDDGTAIADKTNAEINQAYIDGARVVAQINGFNCELIECYGDWCSFKGYDYRYGIERQIEISEDEVFASVNSIGIADIRPWNTLFDINPSTGEYSGVTTFEFTEFPTPNIEEILVYIRGCNRTSITNATLRVNDSMDIQNVFNTTLASDLKEGGCNVLLLNGMIHYSTIFDPFNSSYRHYSHISSLKLTFTNCLDSSNSLIRILVR